MAKSLYSGHQFRLTLRFVQGYRFLDRCGEALINLERALLPDWIPTEATPKGGSMRNDTLGMVAAFSAESVTVQQSDFMAFDLFLDQSCKIVDVLRSTFQIDRYVGPACTFVYQRPFADGNEEAAERALREMGLVTISPKLQTALEGEPAGVTFVYVSQVARQWRGVPVKSFRRAEGRVVRQVPGQPFDERLLRRAGFLPDKQRTALLALQKLRSMHPNTARVATELTLESFFEGEIDKGELPVYDFLTEAHDWAERTIATLSSS